MQARHPPLLIPICIVEVFERFGFYTIMGLLVVWMTAAPAEGGAGWATADAYRLLGIFSSTAFLAPLLGGWLADRWLGQRASVLLGLLAFVAGYGLIATVALLGATPDHMPTLMAGIIATIVGTGLFKPNMNVIVGRLYPPGDPRVESGFTLYWTGINVGGLLAGLLGGTSFETFGATAAFLAATAGLAATTGLFVSMWRRLPPDVRRNRAVATSSEEAGVPSLPVAPAMAAIALLVVPYILFTAALIQIYGLINLYLENRIDRELFGYTVPALHVIALNQVSIILFAPSVARLWQWLHKTGRDPQPLTKFAIAFIVMAGSFCLLALSGSAGSWALAVVAMAVFLTGISEIFIQPIGLALMARLAPAGWAGPVMGLWYLGFAAGQYLAAEVGVLSIRLGETATFWGTAIACSAAALTLFALRGFFRRLVAAPTV